ncbi:hypothetical protein VTL71DRAFT_10465 [Oculimacula yallundae]|uniref:Uncharacterized protein n=1 Tax=Oculimacula yallundae TaxID=86028 RepID=A0ABR4CVD7_9HELO
MCLEITTVYGNCRAVRVHTEICASYIEHTRQQIDNTPCPSFLKDSRYAGITSRCTCKTNPEYGAKGEVICQRAISKGYGENGFTWCFEKGAKVVLKKKRESAREKKVRDKGEGRVDVKKESVEDSAWSASGWNGDRERVRDTRRQKEDSFDRKQVKKLKVEKSPSHSQEIKLESLNDDVQMK